MPDIASISQTTVYRTLKIDVDTISIDYHEPWTVAEYVDDPRDAGVFCYLSATRTGHGLNKMGCKTPASVYQIPRRNDMLDHCRMRGGNMQCKQKEEHEEVFLEQHGTYMKAHKCTQIPRRQLHIIDCGVPSLSVI